MGSQQPLSPGGGVISGSQKFDSGIMEGGDNKLRSIIHKEKIRVAAEKMAKMSESLAIRDDDDDDDDDSGSQTSSSSGGKSKMNSQHNNKSHTSTTTNKPRSVEEP